MVAPRSLRTTAAFAVEPVVVCVVVVGVVTYAPSRTG
jgi:hypothetical protein